MVDLTTPVPDATPIGEMIGGKLHGLSLLRDTAGADAMGLVDPAPAANTLFGRLKAIVDAILRTAPATRIFTITASDTVAVAPTPRALRVLTDGNLVLRGTDALAVTIAVKAGETIPFSPTYVNAASTATVAGLA